MVSHEVERLIPPERRDSVTAVWPPCLGKVNQGGQTPMARRVIVNLCSKSLLEQTLRDRVFVCGPGQFTLLYSIIFPSVGQSLKKLTL